MTIQYRAIEHLKATGRAACRATLVTPGTFPDCVPLDVFGNRAPSAAAEQYIFGTTYFRACNTLNDLGTNLTGDLFDNWAGTVKLAFGLEYRLQRLDETVDPVDNSFDPTNLRGNFAQGTLLYTKDVTAPAHGSNSVYEGSIELNVPLVSGLSFARQISFDGAYRHTHYRISGDADT